MRLRYSLQRTVREGGTMSRGLIGTIIGILVIIILVIVILQLT
jgi:tetrahydromethanopterin S-methyltransferase subunit F